MVPAPRWSLPAQSCSDDLCDAKGFPCTRAPSPAPTPAPTRRLVSPQAAKLGAELRYWLAYCTLRFALRVFTPVLAWLPFVTHIQLLLVLWLQLPFFRGAARILGTVVRLLRGGRPYAF